MLENKVLKKYHKNTTMTREKVCIYNNIWSVFNLKKLLLKRYKIIIVFIIISSKKQHTLIEM